MKKNIEQFSPYLFDYVKQKVDLSEFLSNEIGCKLNWYEPKVSAGTICPMPHHADNNPSFRIKLMDEKTWVFHCLAGDTKVITWDGFKPIKDLAGTTQKILTGGSCWVEAPFFSFGRQKVSQITLSRNGQKKVIRATPDHRWFVRAGKHRELNIEKTTKELQPGMRLSWMFPRNKIKQIEGLSPQGVTHGIIFGDGTAQRTGSLVCLWGKKDRQLLRWFSLNRYAPTGRSNGLKGVRVMDLPLFYKNFPSLNEAPSYLAGFLAGWLAADGCVAKDGTVLLNSSVKVNLEFARLIAMRLGIGTYGITGRLRMGINKKMSYIYQIHFITEDLNERFFLIKEHRKRFLNSHKEWIRRGWVVQSIKENAGEEEVFCAVVDKTHNFVLEDNILTGNCLGCGVKGTIIDFFMEYYGISSSAEAVLSICEKFGFKQSDISVTDSLKDVKKRVNLQRKINSAHVVSARQCFTLLKKDYIKYNKWVAEAYKIMNKALDSEDLSTIESIGFEASNKM